MSSKSDFLKTVIRSLSPEKFSEAVAIFERSYLNNEIVSVDGHDDGGCDIKIFKNRKELNVVFRLRSISQSRIRFMMT